MKARFSPVLVLLVVASLTLLVTVSAAPISLGTIPSLRLGRGIFSRTRTSKKILENNFLKRLGSLDKKEREQVQKTLEAVRSTANQMHTSDRGLDLDKLTREMSLKAFDLTALGVAMERERKMVKIPDEVTGYFERLLHA